MKHFILVAPVALLVVLTLGACSSSPAAASATSPATNSFTLSGNVPTPINGIQQFAVNDFNVGQTGGVVTITLTGGFETLSNGTVTQAVQVGVLLGTPSGAACVIAAGTTITQLAVGQATSGTLVNGAYCVQVSNLDQTTLEGPLSYTLLVTTP
jgi:hypothetical protein